MTIAIVSDCFLVIPAEAGIQELLGPGFRRDDESLPFWLNVKELL